MTSISIIVPVYNLEFYLERCLESLENQTLKDIEVLMIDDGSTDDSPQIIAEFAARDERFRSVRKANGGHGSACNAGIARASGEYVMIVDGDDFLDPDTCEFMYEKALEHEADLLMGNLRYHLMGGVKDVFRPIEIEGERLLTEEDRARLFSSWATPCGRIYRRTMFDDASVRFLPRIIFADVNFAPKTIFAAERIYYVNRELYNYDVTRPTQSMKQTDKRVLNVVPALRDMLEFYTQHFAFRAYEKELLNYTLRHVISWTDKIKNLVGYSRADAMGELFGVLDSYFGDRWLGAPLEEQVGRRRAMLVRQARRFHYAPLAWTWQLREKAGTADDRIERLLEKPLRKYQSLKHRAREALLRRITF